MMIRSIFVYFLVYISAFLFFSCNSGRGKLLPGVRVFDVTNPATWGGDPELAATPDDASDDDAIGINAALQAAMDTLAKYRSGQRYQSSNQFVYQQLIYLPKGVYHLANAIVLPKFRNREQYIWMMGEDEANTILRLKDADEIGLFGSADSVKPVVQFAEYTLGNTAAGNSNFQLFATDFTIIVPDDQPHAVGISYGAANTGAVRNLTVKAEGEGGYTGFALVQYNNGPGLIKNLTVEGFDIGIEINDGWGESYTFSNVTLRNQNAGGAAMSLADKLIGIENLTSTQDEPDVTPVYLFDDDSFNDYCGGAPHLTLINATFVSSVQSVNPVFNITKGHSYLRNISTLGYGNSIIEDHGVTRSFEKGDIPMEYISVHGKTPDEKPNVAFTVNSELKQSLCLPIRQTPAIDADAWESLGCGEYTVVDQNSLHPQPLRVNTPWVVVDPTLADDDTELLQAALNSGAKYIGLLNDEPFKVSKTIVINGEGPKAVELIYGYMSEINATDEISQRKDLRVRNNNQLIRIETGHAETLILKGLRLTTFKRATADYKLIQNNSAQTVVFEDVRTKDASRPYRNGGESYGAHVFFDDVEWTFNGMMHDTLVLFDRQHVWARQLNIEAPINNRPVVYNGNSYSKYTIKPKLYNRGGKLWVLSQKLGEQNGVFVGTDEGGQTELLSVFFNSARTNDWTPSPEATNFVVQDKGSELSLVGQERIRVNFDENGNANRPLPHGDRFGVVISGGKELIIKGTSMPTYLTYEGFDPFTDSDFNAYDQKNHFRVAGLVRVVAE